MTWRPLIGPSSASPEEPEPPSAVVPHPRRRAWSAVRRVRLPGRRPHPRPEGGAVSRRLSLAGQLLALQVVIIAVVLIGVSAVTVAQSTQRASDYESNRAQALAESLAGSRTVRATLESEVGPPSEGALSYFRSTAEARRTDSGAQSVV